MENLRFFFYYLPFGKIQIIDYYFSNVLVTGERRLKSRRAVDGQSHLQMGKRHQTGKLGRIQDTFHQVHYFTVAQPSLSLKLGQTDRNCIVIPNNVFGPKESQHFCFTRLMPFFFFSILLRLLQWCYVFRGSINQGYHSTPYKPKKNIGEI